MLIEQTDKHQVETEPEATHLIAIAKAGQEEGEYTISKAGYTQKFLKEKGEIIGEIFTVTITKKFK